MLLQLDQQIVKIAIPIAIGILLLVLRWLYFNTKVRATRQSRDEYVRILDELLNGKRDLRHYDRLAEVEARLTRLMRQANTSPTGFILRNEPELFGKFGPSPSMVETYVQSLNASVGFYSARRRETFDPVFWIESLFNWPRSLLGFIGFNGDGAFARVLQVVVLILEVAGGLILAVNNL